MPAAGKIEHRRVLETGVPSEPGVASQPGVLSIAAAGDLEPGGEETACDEVSRERPARFREEPGERCAECGRLVAVLEERIEARGYCPEEVVGALGWGELSAEKAGQLTHADLMLVCELIGEPVRELWVELGWLGSHEEDEEKAASLDPVTMAPRDYLNWLVGTRAGGYGHPVLSGWGSLNREELKTEVGRLQRYLTWLLHWLECAGELNRRALARREATARGKSWPNFEPLAWPRPPIPREWPITKGGAKRE